MSGARLAIAGFGWTAELASEIGGAIAALSHGGRAILRPAPDAAASPLDMACFPLVPYANRIAYGRFAYAGREHRLPLNFGDHPHSLHGLGWQAAWEVVNVAPAAVTLGHRHDGGPGWPWAYRAEQQVALGEEGCAVTLSLTNADARPMPAGLGLHPYFPLDAETRLRATADRVWLADSGVLPTVAVAADRLGDWAACAAVQGDFLIDNYYEGWNGAATIVQGEGAIRIAAEGVRGFHVYRPPGADYFCFEPVSHFPDALNRPGFAMDMLAPGETLKLAMRLVA